ncbi:MAG: IMP cyclohydrolase [Candidatus Hydrogenedens sp.]|nr:IMP cyclohydrolase [Candidatus Hydrogenedens sp.]
MYIGRIVCVARTPQGRLAALYRVSSRSFPNRMAVADGTRISIVPKPGHEGDIQKNPYIAYNCVKLVRDATVAVATNGSQTDPIAEKIALGMPVREALALTHLAMDYEKDDYNTPRVSAVVDRAADEAWLAVVRADGLEVRKLALAPGSYCYVATYEENSISPSQGGACDFEGAEAATAFMLGGGIFAERTNPVTGVAAVATDAGFDLHAQDAPGDA